MVWTTSPVSRQHPGQFVSHLPNLVALDDKCRMADLIRTASGGRAPRWLPLTYCLPEELPALADHWKEADVSTSCRERLAGDVRRLSSQTLTSKHSSDGHQQADGGAGTWIVKPPHLARGWDIIVTSSLPCIVRHLQTSERLSVSQYISEPDLFRGRKYDLRLYVLLLSPHQVRVGARSLLHFELETTWEGG